MSVALGTDAARRALVDDPTPPSSGRSDPSGARVEVEEQPPLPRPPSRWGWLNSTVGRFAIGFALIAGLAAHTTVTAQARQRQATEWMIERQLQIETDRSASQIDQLLRLRRNGLAAVAGSERLKKAVLAPGESTAREAAQVLRDAQGVLEDAEGFCLWGADGTLLVSHGVERCEGFEHGTQFRLVAGHTLEMADVPIADRGVLVAIFGPHQLDRALPRGDFDRVGYLLDGAGVVLGGGGALGLVPGRRVENWVRPADGTLHASSRVGDHPLWVQAELDKAQLAPMHEDGEAVIALGGLIACLGIGIILFLIARDVTGPIRRVIREARAIPHKQFSVRIPLKGTTEARELAGTINAMASELEGLYGKLEAQVAQRSKALNRALQHAQGLQQLAQSQTEELAAQNEALQAQAAELAIHQQALNQRNEILAEKNSELERASKLKNEFVANMSHELRTPLNAVIGFSELLIEGLGGSLNEEQREYVQDIHNAGRHLLAMINDILDLAKVEAGRMVLRPEVVPLGLPVREAEQMIRPLAAARGLQFEVTIDEAVEVVGDLQRIRQVVLNLLSNAVKFTPSGGRVTAVVRRASGRAELVVQDTGIGIDPAHHELVFEAFRQVDGSLSRTFDGTGLGLTLVKKFVEAMEGKVELDSAPGRGSTFTVRLPTAPSAEVPRSVSDEGRFGRVLVVEDDDSVRELLRKVLSAHGHHVQTASCGATALKALTGALPDVLVLDLMIPHASGLDVLKHLRTLEGGGEVPVLVLSAREPWGAEADELRELSAEYALKGSLHTSEFLHRVGQMATRAPTRRAA